MVYTIGETVVDIIINSFDDVKIRPGGSMLNSAVSLGRMKVPVTHISYIANDELSAKLSFFLEENGIVTTWLKQCKGIKTNLALAFLDDQQKASYSFYKYFPEESELLTFPKPLNGDIILFGSFFSLNPQIHIKLMEFINEAKQVGAIIIYDPNFRKPHLSQLKELQPLISKNMESCSILKASDEDMQLIFGVGSGIQAWEVAKKLGVKMMFYTKGEQGAEVFTDSFHMQALAHPVKVVSTVGAGDTFSAALIYGLLSNDLEKKGLQISKDEVENLLKFAIECSSIVCGLFDNYLPVGFKAHV